MLFVILKTVPCNPSTQKFEVMGLSAYIVTSKQAELKSDTLSQKPFTRQDKNRNENIFLDFIRVLQAQPAIDACYVLVCRHVGACVAMFVHV